VGYHILFFISAMALIGNLAHHPDATVGGASFSGMMKQAMIEWLYTEYGCIVQLDRR
jgi:hypothetical protein